MIEHPDGMVPAGVADSLQHVVDSFESSRVLVHSCGSHEQDSATQLHWKPVVDLIADYCTSHKLSARDIHKAAFSLVWHSVDFCKKILAEADMQDTNQIELEHQGFLREAEQLMSIQVALESKLSVETQRAEQVNA